MPDPKSLEVGKMVLGVRIGSGEVGPGKRSIPTDNIKDEELVVWRPNPKIYKGLKGTGRTVSGIKVFWFEISENNGLFRDFLRNPVEVWNDEIATVVAGVVDEAKLKEEEITGISVRLNVKASAIELRTSEERYVLYVFSTGQIRLIKAKNKPYNGLPQFLQNSEVIKEYSELPNTKERTESFEIREVRGI